VTIRSRTSIWHLAARGFINVRKSKKEIAIWKHLFQIEYRAGLKKDSSGMTSSQGLHSLSTYLYKVQ
jgi:hypothetical protein